MTFSDFLNCLVQNFINRTILFQNILRNEQYYWMMILKQFRVIVNLSENAFDVIGSRRKQLQKTKHRPLIGLKLTTGLRLFLFDFFEDALGGLER